MTFDEVLGQVQELLRREQRVSYRGLKRRFALDDEYLEDLKEELIGAKRVAADEDGRFLVWTGASPAASSASQLSSSQSQVQGSPPSTASPQPVAPSSSTEDERKIITALFADLAGFTTLAKDLDPEETRAIIDPALQLMMDAVHRYDGSVAQSLGDGIFALFGAPLAHEDHPQRALHAALLMQEEMRLYANRIRAEKGIPLQIRIGVSTGEVILRSVRKDELHTDYVPVGHAINLAARMESLALPGSIVVSESTHPLIEGYFDCKALGAVQIKGLDTPVHVYEVLGVGPLHTRIQVATRRGLVRFVGRQRELDHLKDALDHAVAGRGQIVGVMGEPGVGKSRLFHEFVGAYCNTTSRSDKNCLVLQTFPVSHGKAYPYLPLIDLLQHYFGITSQDDEKRRREKVLGKVLALDRGLEDTLPYLLAVLGNVDATASLQSMDPQIRKQRTFAAVTRLFFREAVNQPLVVIFEDLHWLDNETEEFLQAFSESVPAARLLLLVNYRPEYQHPWGSKTYYTQLRLDPLAQEDAHSLLDVLLGDEVRVKGAETDVRAFRHFILEKTAGAPFFMEEIVQALFEQRVITREANEITVLRSLTDLRLPSTVQGVLAARLDRLAPEEKALLQTLSVIGKEFRLNVVRRVTATPEGALWSGLRRLQEGEFLYERPAFPEPEYLFKHVLTQEVAYNSIPTDRRKLLHEQTAQALEALYPDRLDRHYGELAHHYGRSGNAEKAIAYLYKTGQQAAQRSAHTEAIDHLTSALELLRTLPDTPEYTQQELDVQLALAASLQATKGPSAPEVEHAYTRARDLLQQKGEIPELFSVLRGLWVLHHVRANLAAARELGAELRVIAERAQDAALLLEAHRALGSTLLWQGDFPLARTHLEQAIAYYDPQLPRSLTLRYGGADPGVSCLCELARVLWFLGYPNQALRQSQAALTLAQSLADPFSLGYALIFAAGLHQLRREGKATEDLAEEGITLAREHGFVSLLSAGTIRRGWAVAEQGQEEAGLLQMQQGLTARQTTGAELAQPYFLALQAEIYGKLGKAERAMTLLSEALAATSVSEEHRLEAELYRIKGQLTLQKGAGDWELGAGPPSPQTPRPKPEVPSGAEHEAEGYFLKAIEIAQNQQAKSLELRATSSLARLWHRQGKAAEAHQRLFEIYHWFTEGFDTKDLQEAEALIKELSR
jgi:class 3 adenylate cyclase/predicted ATPase